MKDKSVLVAFGRDLPTRNLSSYGTVLSGKELENLIDPGSIYDAANFLKDLSYLTLPDGIRVTKSFIYKGYELWWIYYSDLFLYFCLPYTQYKKLLEYLKDFDHVYLYKPPYKSLFYYYLESYGSKITLLDENKLKSPAFLPFGILIQIILTLLSMPILVVMRRKIMVFVGDKFDKGKDFDFRMTYIYRELREREIPFVEFIRSLESWKSILEHAFVVRRRPVIYSEGVVFLGRLMSFLTFGNSKIKRKFGPEAFTSETPEKKFRLMIATRHLAHAQSDVWAIRIMKLVLRVIGIKAAYFTAAMDRNYHSFLAAKLNYIPTVGILHGVASLYYNVYDFLPGYDGEKSLSVDKYGLWSQWWRQYYIKNSRVYSPEQLFISGLMRPLERTANPSTSSGQATNDKNTDPIKVLLVPGELSNPKEILPYLLKLMEAEGIRVYLTFRPYRDSFENWLKANNPEIIEKIGKDRILLGNIHKLFARCDVIVGSYSTGTIEALLQLKPIVLFQTNKWGDYFSLKEYENGNFYAMNPNELVEKIKKVRNTPQGVLKDLEERFFGDQHQNGSKWVVDQLEGVWKGRMRK